MKMILCENQRGNSLFFQNLYRRTLLREAGQGIFYFLLLAIVLTQMFLIMPVSAQSTKKKTQKPNADSPQPTEQLTKKTGMDKPIIPLNPTPAPAGPQFATNWIDVESLSREEQINKVAQKVVALHDTLKAHRLLSRDQPIQKLNEMWQKDKADFNKQWLDELFQKQDTYLKKLQTYNNSIQSENHKKGDIETLTREIATLEKRIGDIEARIEETERWQENLKAVLESRLENIPISIVLVGRTQFQGTRAEIKKIIKYHLSVAAVQEIIGSRIQSYSVIKNDSLIANFIAKTEEGNVEVSEIYFRESTKLLPERGQDNYYVYQFNRLEVYPFSKEKPISKTPETRDSAPAATGLEVNVYIAANNALALYPGKNAMSSFENLKLTSQEQEFIRSQVEIADSSNTRVEDEIQKFRREYDEKYNEYDQTLKKFGKDVMGWKKQKTGKEDSLQALRVEVDNLLASKQEKEEQYKASRHAYENHYKNKKGYANKYELWADPPVTPKSHLEEMAKSTFNIINDINKVYTKTTVWLEAFGEDSLKKTEKKELVYHEAGIKKFRILYLTVNNDPFSFILNVAYEVGWRSKDDVETDFKNGVLVDNAQELFWKQASMEMQSPGYPGEPPGSGWRLPIIKELAQLARGLHKQYGNQWVDAFKSLSWPVESAISYSSEESFVNQNNETEFWCYDIASERKISVHIEESVYVLWVKPANPKTK